MNGCYIHFSLKTEQFIFLCIFKNLQPSIKEEEKNPRRDLYLSVAELKESFCFPKNTYFHGWPDNSKVNHSSYLNNAQTGVSLPSLLASPKKTKG